MRLMTATPPPDPSAPAVSGRPELHSTADDDHPGDLLCISWNQDYECFAAGTTGGFVFYNCSPFGEALRRICKGGGFRIVEMLHRSNRVVLVGDGADPSMQPNKVVIWDDFQCSRDELQFRAPVRAVKLTEDRLVVVLYSQVFVYRFPDIKLVGKIVTSPNPNGVCALSHDSENAILACPGLQRGQVRIEHQSLKTIKFVNAHDSEIACITLSCGGLLLATASVKGTLIRIYSTADGTCLQEVRRGKDKASIHSITFSPDLQWLAVTSDRRTIHVFYLKSQRAGEDASRQNPSNNGPKMVHQNSSTSVAAVTSRNMSVNPSSSLSFIKGVLPRYFSSEWSFAQFHLPEATRYIAAFGSQNTVAIVGMDGSFYRCSFDPVNGGQMVQKEYFRFLNHRSSPSTT